MDPALPADPELTLCEASVPTGSGWWSHDWVAADCTHGLPRPDAWGLGSGTNGAGTHQQVACLPATGRHYNGAATSGVVQCLYQNPAVPPEPGGGNDALSANGAAGPNMSGHFWTARGKTNASLAWTLVTASRNRVNWGRVFQPRDLSVKRPPTFVPGDGVLTLHARDVFNDGIGRHVPRPIAADVTAPAVDGFKVTGGQQ